MERVDMIQFSESAGLLSRKEFRIYPNLENRITLERVIDSVKWFTDRYPNIKVRVFAEPPLGECIVVQRID